MTEWRNRITGLTYEAPDQLLANPKNWRIHPAAQQQLLRGVLDEVGWVGVVLQNDVTGHMIDGHDRVSNAISSNQKQVPVLHVELSEDEEDLVLATFDPIGALAIPDQAKLDELIAGIHTTDVQLVQFLADLGTAAPDLPLVNGVDGHQALFTNEHIIDAAMSYFRKAGFPYRNLPLHVCMQELNKLADCDWDSLDGTDLGYHVADTYHPHRFRAHATGKKSPVESFSIDASLRHAFEMQLESGGEIGSSLIGPMLLVLGTQACANFRPGVALKYYRRYCAPGATVLDTSTGYGGRLVGFMASRLGGRYIGVDPNAETHAGNTRMAEEFGFADSVELHCMPIEDVPSGRIEGRCDFAFTSPPYFAKERYSDDDSQSWVRYKTGDEWRVGFLRRMFEQQYLALRSGAKNVVVIADVTVGNRKYPLAQWAVDEGQAAGFHLDKHEKFDLPTRLGANQSDDVPFESILTFERP